MDPGWMVSEIDNNIAALRSVSEKLRAATSVTCIESVLHLDLARIEERANALAAMRHLHAALQKLTTEVGCSGAAVSALHRAEVKAAHDELDRVAAEPKLEPVSEPISEPISEPTPSAPMTWAMSVGKSNTEASARIPTGLQSIQVVGEIYIDAVVLSAELDTASSVFAAVTGGHLYYVPAWDHFAVRVGSQVLHANMGRIYAATPKALREKPERVKECYSKICPGLETCGFYHDPELVAGSTEARNFLADSWHYAAARGRKFGSVVRAEAELAAISVEDARQFMHQTAHDVICAQILWQCGAMHK